jgi:hypothetical protein
MVMQHWKIFNFGEKELPHDFIFDSYEYARLGRIELYKEGYSNLYIDELSDTVKDLAKH